MLSILIPTYNYNIYPLVRELYKQCIAIKTLDFEIIVVEDGSTLFFEQNSQIGKLRNCKHIQLKENIGRTAVRNLLANKATFGYLLFLDADVRLISEKFINVYLLYLKKINLVVFGGCDYNLNSYSLSTSLRFYYGKKREAINSAKRNEKPFKHIFSANFLIRKVDFLSLNIPEDNIYGMDNVFSYFLFKSNKEIIHIDNAVWHCGLEENHIFIEKSLKSVELRKLKSEIVKDFSDSSFLIKTYKILNFFPINTILKLSFKILNSSLKKMFLKPKPNLFAFDLYRLLYLFKLD